MSPSATSPGLANTKLFEPLKLGNLELKTRIVMAPLTRGRSPEHIPNPLNEEYYTQRASAGSLLISEAVHISVMGGNYTGVPGVFTPEQRRGWKKVTDGVHSKGGYIYAQLWHVGRTTHPDLLGGRAPFGPSANREDGGIVLFTQKGMQDSVVSQPMTLQDINDTIEDYAHAARTAIDAGFDGVEIHAANGYLLDQFLSDAINHRTDGYGGSVQNRARLTLEVVDAVVAAIGRDRVSIRLSPFSFFQGSYTSSIFPDYTYVLEHLDPKGLAFIELVEPRADIMRSDEAKKGKLVEIAAAQGIELKDLMHLGPLRKVVKQTPVLVGGGYNAETILNGFDKEGSNGDAVVMGRYFISNPDLVERLRSGKELTKYDRATFYTKDSAGYTDYKTWEEQKGEESKL